jgi:hypothetical protein
MALEMVSTGIIQVLRIQEKVDKSSLHLGYPVYFLTILGIWKLWGAAVILTPKYALLKEWAYAGFFFARSGAIISHMAGKEDLKELFGATLLSILTLISWYFRPKDRKLVFTEKALLEPRVLVQ